MKGAQYVFHYQWDSIIVFPLFQNTQKPIFDSKLLLNKHVVLGILY